MNHLTTKDHVSLTVNIFIITEIIEGVLLSLLNLIGGHITHKKMSVAYEKHNWRSFEQTQKPLQMDYGIIAISDFVVFSISFFNITFNPAFSHKYLGNR